MQTFKQYLKEDQYNPNGYDLSPMIKMIADAHVSDAEEYGYERDGEIPASQAMESGCKEAVQKAYGSTADCYFGLDKNLEIFIDTIDFSTAHIRKVASDIDKILQIELGVQGSQNLETSLFFREAPKPGTHSDYKTIEFYLGHSKPIMLTGFDKMFPNARTISFFYIEKVAGNILSLLKIKSLFQVTFTGPENSTADKWLQIINKELLHPNRDIMDVQEKLMDAGLEDYAQL